LSRVFEDEESDQKKTVAIAHIDGMRALARYVQKVSELSFKERLRLDADIDLDAPLSDEEILIQVELIERCFAGEEAEIFLVGSVLLLLDELERHDGGQISPERRVEMKLAFAPYWTRPGVPRNFQLYCNTPEFARWEADSPRKRLEVAVELVAELKRLKNLS
jgi:hypothetical protein